jgi:ethanolaminephosphotransferase
MGKLTRQQLEGLNLYKYSGVDKQVPDLPRSSCLTCQLIMFLVLSPYNRSLLSKTILTPYWNHLVTYFPKTIAPNTVSLLSLLLSTAERPGGF